MPDAGMDIMDIDGIVSKDVSMRFAAGRTDEIPYYPSPNTWPPQILGQFLKTILFP